MQMSAFNCASLVHWLHANVFHLLTVLLYSYFNYFQYKTRRKADETNIISAAERVEKKKLQPMRVSLNNLPAIQNICLQKASEIDVWQAGKLDAIARSSKHPVGKGFFFF